MFLDEHKMDKKFDLVTLSALLEHLPNPLPALKQLKKYMKKEGHIFVRIPHEKSKWYASTHLFLHSKDSITNVFDKAGLKITKFKKYGQEFYILAGHK